MGEARGEVMGSDGRKGVCEGLGVPRLKQEASEMRSKGECASARTCHKIAAWLRGEDFETVDEGPEPAKQYVQGRSSWKAVCVGPKPVESSKSLGRSPWKAVAD
ncbi:hypothetical protein CRG98_017628 [Punica granatum]|uniref:Uncharacterized protein n=1 Tax=Punica granatum TaxID=22663 RepID=A0A2I0K2R3_PUNGR|nr:hypothetical protein CRG98_017628 [Punica granatum]